MLEFLQEKLLTQRLLSNRRQTYISCTNINLAIFVLVLLTTLIYGSFLFGMMSEDWFIGHGDAANNAVVARNLLNGQGFTVDYIWQFYLRYSEISHPEDTWPPLQPLLMAGTQFIFGQSVPMAKLLNVILLCLLPITIYLSGKELFSPIVAGLAALFVVLNYRYIYVVERPLNDVGGVLLFTLFLFLFNQSTQFLNKPQPNYGLWITTGVVLGLNYLQKPFNGFVLATTTVIGLSFYWFLYLRKPTKAFYTIFSEIMIPIGTIGLSALITASPWLIRNILLFHSPFFSLEHYHSFIHIFRPSEEIYKIYFDNSPSWKTLVDYGFEPVIVTIIKDKFLLSLKAILRGDILAPVFLVFVLIGLAASHTKPKLTGLAIFTQIAFIVFYMTINLLWHYEQRYYLVFLPIFYLFSLSGIFSIVSLTKNFNRHHFVFMLSITTLLGIFAVKDSILPALPLIRNLPQRETALQEAYVWLLENVDQQKVIMTRNPWQTTYHTQLKSIQIPNEDTRTIVEIAKTYNVGYLFIEKDMFDLEQRPQLDILLQGQPIPGFELIYNSTEIWIYKIEYDDIILP